MRFVTFSDILKNVKFSFYAQFTWFSSFLELNVFDTVSKRQKIQSQTLLRWRMHELKTMSQLQIVINHPIFPQRWKIVVYRPEIRSHRVLYAHLLPTRIRMMDARMDWHASTASLSHPKSSPYIISNVRQFPSVSSLLRIFRFICIQCRSELLHWRF